MNKNDTPYGVGVLVVKDGIFLCGLRSDTGEICVPGGHVGKDEDPGSDYKGVHIGAVSPSGQQIELQIHSKQSMKVKETIHPMYDVSSESNGRLINARKLEMKDISATLDMPKDMSSEKTWKK